MSGTVTEQSPAEQSPAEQSQTAVALPRPTHEVLNQPPPLEDYDLYGGDIALQEAVVREGGGWDDERLRACGVRLGSAELFAHGRAANTFLPQVALFDRFGNRINQITYHPSYHALMAESVRWQIHSQPWVEPRRGALVARMAKSFMMGQVEQGHGCPITMTFAAVPALRHQPEIASWWVPRITAGSYDGSDRPASEKPGLTIGMAMTEKQGGSDVRANTTVAVAAGGRTGPGAAYRLVGHKWFCSAPMCDAFLTLAHTDRGLSCFLLPRWAPDGDGPQLEVAQLSKNTAWSRNPMWVQRLKDKVGNRSNASSEVEYHGALAWMVGEEGRGIRTILEMVAHTRLDCIIGSAATLRQCVAQAAWHARHRAAFGGRLIDKPLMRNVLADLQLESEAATAVAFRIGRAWDEARAHDDGAGAAAADSRPFARIATAIAKYHVCKVAPTVAYEAMECLGGGGFVEESPLGRHFRDSPVNSIWEGSGNVICLDVLRALTREPESGDALFEELGGSVGLDSRFDAHVRKLRAALDDGSDLELHARDLVEQAARALQGAVLLKAASAGTGSAAVAEAFCAGRLAAGSSRHFGTLPRGVDLQTLLERSAIN